MSQKNLVCPESQTGVPVTLEWLRVYPKEKTAMVLTATALRFVDISVLLKEIGFVK